jgi:hypothetical protein
MAEEMTLETKQRWEDRSRRSRRNGTAATNQEVREGEQNTAMAEEMTLETKQRWEDRSRRSRRNGAATTQAVGAETIMETKERRNRRGKRNTSSSGLPRSVAAVATSTDTSTDGSRPGAFHMEGTQMGGLLVEEGRAGYTVEPVPLMESNSSCLNEMKPLVSGTKPYAG